MAQQQSIVAELLQKINLTKQRPTPAYLSINDGMSVAEFANSPYSQNYTVDTSNIYWGQEFNDSHVFDAYSVFTQDHSNVKLRLDMLTFVAQNAERYKWDCYVYFKMHGVLLDKWVNKMTYWGSRADELSLYTLSDMLNVHTFVVTGSKPWTTFHQSVIGTEMEMLDLCPVKLIHLGQYMFGKQVPKQTQSLTDSNLTTSPPTQPSMIPGSSTQFLREELSDKKDKSTSVPTLTMPSATSQDPMKDQANAKDKTASEPTLSLPTPYEELETVHTLADMMIQIENQLDLQNPLPRDLPTLPLVLIDRPPIVEHEPFSDTMDKLVNHPDVSFSGWEFWCKVTDFTNQIIACVNVETEATVKTPTVKECSVVLTKLYPVETFPVKLPTLQTEQDLLDIGAYFTRSKRIPKKLRTCRIPRSVSTNITYCEPDSTRDIDSKKPKRKQSTAPPADGPSAMRVLAHQSNTEAPKVQTLSKKFNSTPNDSPAPSDSDETIDVPLEKAEVKGNTADNSTKGKLAVQSYTLRKAKKVLKYKCRLCQEVCDSAHLLTVHHQATHGILYCDQCTKAFNNPTSLERHHYQHKELKYVCTCGAKFAFESQLQTHSIVHRKIPEHHCVYPK